MANGKIVYQLIALWGVAIGVGSYVIYSDIQKDKKQAAAISEEYKKDQEVREAEAKLNKLATEDVSLLKAYQECEKGQPSFLKVDYEATALNYDNLCKQKWKDSQKYSECVGQNPFMENYWELKVYHLKNCKNGARNSYMNNLRNQPFVPNRKK